MENPARSVAAAAGTDATKVRWKIFALLLAIVTINYIDRSSLSVAMPRISKELQLNPALTGVILSSFFWTYTLMQVPGGWLADRIRPRRLISWATTGWGLAQGLTGLARSGFTLVLMRLLLGVCEAPVYPAGGKLNALWMPARERGRGATLLDGGAPLGTAVGGPVIAGLILWLGNWRAAFILAGLGTMLAGLLAWWYIRDHPEEHPAVNAAEREYIERELAQEEAAARSAIPERRNLWRYLRFRSFWCMCLGWLGFDLVFYGLVTWAPYYLANARHFSLALVGGAIFVIFGAGFVGELVGGYLADWWKGHGGHPNVVMRTLLGIAGAITTLAVFSVAYVPDAASAVALLAVVLFFLRWAGLYWSVPATLTDRANAGLLGGAMNFVGNVGGILVPIVVGLIVNATGSFFWALMFFAASGLLFLFSSLLLDYSRKLPV